MKTNEKETKKIGVSAKYQLDTRENPTSEKNKAKKIYSTSKKMKQMDTDESSSFKNQVEGEFWSGPMLLKERLQQQGFGVNEKTEMKARLSVFDSFMFLLEDDDDATKNPIVMSDEESSCCSIDDDSKAQMSSMEYYTKVTFPSTAEDQDELKQRLSVFDPFFFLLDNPTTKTI